MSEETNVSSTPVQSQTQEGQVSSENQSNNNLEITENDLQTLVGGDDSAEAKAVADAQKEVDNAKTLKEKEAAKKKLENAKRVYKLKVDGIEEEVALSDDEIVRELQLARKARKEIQTSAEIKKELGLFLHLLKTDPKKALSDPAIGLDLKALAQDIINEQIEEELKSPEQKEKERLERELEELRAKIREDEERRSREEYERMVQQAEQDIEEKLQEALETSGLPKTPYVLKRVADVMLSGMENNKDISPKQALNIVKREMQRDLKEMFSVSPEDLIEELIGNEVLKKLNKRQLAKIKQAAQNVNSIKDTGHVDLAKRSEVNKKVEKIKISDWLKNK